jgi:hypothetical protein
LVKALYANDIREVHTNFNVDSAGRWLVDSVELVRLTEECGQLLPNGAAQAVAVIHGTIEAADPNSFLRAHQRVLRINPLLATDASSFVRELLTDNVQLSRESRQVATSISFVTMTGGLRELPGYESLDGWTVADQWLWHLDRGPELMPDAVGLADFRTQQVVMNAKLRGLVTFQGLTIVGCDSDPVNDRGYYRGTSFQIHTLYADALILGMLQRLLLRQLPSEISVALSRQGPDEQSLSSIRHDLLVMRETYWSVDFGHRGIMDTILERFQVAYDMVKALTTVFADLDDHVAEVQVTTNQQTNALLTLLAAIGLPYTLATAIWASWATATSAWDNQRWVWLFVALLAATALFIFISRLELLRESLRLLLSRPRRMG